MLDAVWSVNFTLPNGTAGSGVVVIDHGRITGGDGAFVYTGHLQAEGDYISAELEVRKYQDPKSLYSAVGTRKFKVALKGRKRAGKYSLQGTAANGLSLSAELIRLEDLPV